MITGKNFIGKTPTATGTNHLTAINPATGETLEGQFAVATASEIEQATALAKAAAISYSQTSAKEKAAFLTAIADEIMALGDELIQRAMAESALPEGRLTGERGRTCNQLKAFATLLEEGSFVNATIDTAIPDRQPLPKVDLRKMDIALGPVAVFGASNFPLAFSTAGGDTASALAAGCPVIVKGHESHLGTNELVSSAILKAAEKTGMQNGVFSMVNGGAEVGQALITDPIIQAVGFTGSYRGGKAIFDAAAKREQPIPVYAEMGSTNPVLLLEEKLESSAEALGEQLANSVTLGVGQFCTNPGLIIGVASEALNTFAASLSKSLEAIAPATMLNKGIADVYEATSSSLANEAGVTTLAAKQTTSNNQASPLAMEVSGDTFLANPKLHQEVFGPLTLLVKCSSAAQMTEVVAKLEGQLTGTVMATEADVKTSSEVVQALKEKVGRILFNGVPTGVEVCPSMHHGGPFPSTTNPKYTSVGTDAIHRFMRPICYQSWPQAALPDALKDENPLGIWRTVDGTFTNQPIS